MFVVVAYIFWTQMSGSAVFIGESDRLNSYLNIRLAEYDALHAYGRVPTWNPSMFGGFSMAALHWMNPGKDPVPYLLQFFPRSEVFQVLGYLPIILVFTACATAYFYIRDITGEKLAASVGALGYGLSVFSLHRASQVDNAHLTVVLIPVAMLAIRRARPQVFLGPFVGLTTTLAILAYWGFLQEVAYAFIAFGVYALYRSAALNRKGRWHSFAPIAVFSSAAFIALLFAAPRLITIANNFSLLGRGDVLNNDDYGQIFRFFHEGIYGRYFEEAVSLGNEINLSEGLQLVSSSALSIFVFLNMTRPATWPQAVAATFFFAIFAGLLPTMGILYPRMGKDAPMSPEFINFLTYGVVCLGLMIMSLKFRGALQAAKSRPADTTYHMFALVFVLFLVVMPEGKDLMAELFLRIDFTHSRVSILAVLPLCTLFSVFLVELSSCARRCASTASPTTAIGLAVAITVTGGIAYWLQSASFKEWAPGTATPLLLLNRPALPTTAISTLVIAGLISCLIVASLLFVRVWPSVGLLASLAVGTFVVIQTVGYADLKVAGPQTWTYPVPFRMFNYFNAPKFALRPPDESQLAEFRKAFDVDDFRMVVLSDDPKFLGIRISHLTAFWGARTIGGYGAGVDKRLVSLPWSKNVQTLRTIDFRTFRDLTPAMFPLLAFLNVKYLIILTPAVYFNVPTDAKATGPQDLRIGGKPYPLQTANIGGVTFSYVENPVKVLPRQFMVAQIAGVAAWPKPLSPLPMPHGNSKLRILEGQTDNLTRTSFVEGLSVGKIEQFDTSGPLSVAYRGDVITIDVEPSEKRRFVVLNQTYHPAWRVFAGGATYDAYPTNLVMTGILIGPKIGHVELKFVPFSTRWRAAALMFSALCCFGLFVYAFHRRGRSPARAS